MQTTGRALVSASLLLLAGCSGGGKHENESTQAPRVDSVTPPSGIAGTSVTLAGEDFGGEQETSTVTFGGVSASVPPGAATRSW